MTTQAVQLSASLSAPGIPSSVDWKSYFDLQASVGNPGGEVSPDIQAYVFERDRQLLGPIVKGSLGATKTWVFSKQQREAYDWWVHLGLVLYRVDPHREMSYVLSVRRTSDNSELVGSAPLRIVVSPAAWRIEDMQNAEGLILGANMFFVAAACMGVWGLPLLALGFAYQASGEYLFVRATSDTYDRYFRAAPDYRRARRDWRRPSRQTPMELREFLDEARDVNALSRTTKVAFNRYLSARSKSDKASASKQRRAAKEATTLVADRVAKLERDRRSAVAWMARNMDDFNSMVTSANIAEARRPSRERDALLREAGLSELEIGQVEAAAVDLTEERLRATTSTAIDDIYHVATIAAADARISQKEIERLAAVGSDTLHRELIDLSITEPPAYEERA